MSTDKLTPAGLDKIRAATKRRIDAGYSGNCEQRSLDTTILSMCDALEAKDKEMEFLRGILKSITYACLDCDHQPNERCGTCSVTIATAALNTKGGN